MDRQQNFVCSTGGKKHALGWMDLAQFGLLVFMAGAWSCTTICVRGTFACAAQRLCARDLAWPTWPLWLLNVAAFAFLAANISRSNPSGFADIGLAIVGLAVSPLLAFAYSVLELSCTGFRAASLIGFRAASGSPKV